MGHPNTILSDVPAIHLNPVLVMVSSSISLLFSLVMLLFYITNKRLRKTSRIYLLMINICDFVVSLCFLMSCINAGFMNGFIVRKIEGYLIQFFYLASFLWTLCYSFYLYSLVIHHTEKRARHWSNQVIAWSLPTISVIVFIIMECCHINVMGNCDRIWPWISNETPHSFYYRMGFMYIPIFLIIIMNSIIYICISCKSKGEDLHCFILLRSLAYILVAILSIGWSGADRIFVFFKGKHINYSFDIISFSIPLLGCLNVCAYSLNKFFFNAIKRETNDLYMDSTKDLMEESVPLSNSGNNKIVL